MKNLSRRAFGAVTLASLMALTACANVGADRPAATVAQLVASNPELSTFGKLAATAGLQSTLEGAGPITVFIPTDEAFKAVPAATMDKLSKDPAALKAVLTYHVVPGLVKTADIAGSSSLTTQNGAKLSVSKAGDFLTVDDGLATKTDIAVGNGVVHIVDRVLMPPKK